jgi:hypothetical protein
MREPFQKTAQEELEAFQDVIVETRIAAEIEKSGHAANN